MFDLPIGIKFDRILCKLKYFAQLHKKCIVLFSMIVLLLLTCVGVFFMVTKSVTVEVGSTPDINISDTEAPTADISSFDILLGEKISDEDIVKNVTDHSEVTTEFLSRADFDTVGEHTVNIRLTDEHGNKTEYTSYIRIHDISKEITAEIFSSNNTLSDLIFNDEWSKSNLTFEKDNVLNGLGLGKHVVTLNGKYNQIFVNVNPYRYDSAHYKRTQEHCFESGNIILLRR